jgi:hypothetical protein
VVEADPFDGTLLTASWMQWLLRADGGGGPGGVFSGKHGDSSCGQLIKGQKVDFCWGHRRVVISVILFSTVSNGTVLEVALFGFKDKEDMQPCWDTYDEIHFNSCLNPT